jgi:hypothetical protein
MVERVGVPVACGTAEKEHPQVAVRGIAVGYEIASPSDVRVNIDVPAMDDPRRAEEVRKHAMDMGWSLWAGCTFPDFPPDGAASDGVHHPPHYNAGSIEVIDVIEDWKLGFNLGNAVKYVARSEHKGAPLKDLQKARWYIDREITRRQRVEAA